MLAVVLAGAATLGTALASAGTLNGAGSTLIAPLEQEWATSWQDGTGNILSYAPIGSSGGIARISGRLVDFGTSEAPLSPADAAGCNGCVQIPWALSAVAVPFNLAGVTRLRLTGRVLAAIYLGRITSWNSPSIRKLNPGVELPTETITPVHQGDGAGASFAFSGYLSRVSPSWASKVGSSTTITWPTGVAATDDAQMMAAVASTPGAIGYTGASYAVSRELAVAAIRNAAGRFEYPNGVNIENAARSVTTVPADNALDIVDPPAQHRIAYPISTFSYVIVPTTTVQSELLKSFIGFALNEGQSFDGALDFAPLPAVVRSAAERALGTIN